MDIVILVINCNYRILLIAGTSEADTSSNDHSALRTLNCPYACEHVERTQGKSSCGHLKPRRSRAICELVMIVSIFPVLLAFLDKQLLN